MPKSQQPYSKSALSPADIVELAIERGLRVSDKERARHYIKHIGYYRLSGYIRYFCDDDLKHEKIRLGTTFDDVLDLYIFDRRLRVLLGDALERIEIALKAHICDEVSIASGNAFWLSDAGLFNYGEHPRVLQIVDDALDGRRENHPHLPIAHFYKNYVGSYPPGWMLMECISFGGISNIYRLLKGPARKPIADAFGLQHDVLQSWLHSLAFARNICAHHGRLWNRSFTITPKIPRQYAPIWPISAQQRLYILSCIIQHMMKIIADESEWPTRLRELISNGPEARLKHMGFPPDWQTHPQWA